VACNVSSDFELGRQKDNHKNIRTLDYQRPIDSSNMQQ
jgi:hypothetical protein